MPFTIRNALTAGCLTPAILAAHDHMTPALIAQEPVHVRPLLAVTETYDSNISSSSLRPLGDFITRVSLVGSNEQVAGELGRCIAAGVRTAFLDVPPDEDELTHAFAALAAAMQPVH